MQYNRNRIVTERYFAKSDIMTDQSIKNEIKELENISVIALENLEAELNEFSKELNSSDGEAVEIISVSNERPLCADIRKVY